MSSSDPLSLGMKRSGHVRAQRTRSKCRRFITVLARHLRHRTFQNGALIIVSGLCREVVQSYCAVSQFGAASPSPSGGLFFICCQESLPASGACMSGVSVTDCRKTPALRPRLLWSYVSAAFFSKRKRVHNGHIAHAGSTLPNKGSPCQSIKKGSRPAIGRKPYSRFNHLLHHT